MEDIAKSNYYSK